MPLKFTLLGILDVTFKIPAVMVKTLAIPKTALVDKLSVVPLIVTLYKLAVPFKLEEPVKVAVPVVAVKLPLTSNEFEIENEAVADKVPEAAKAKKPMVPAPVIVLELPLIVTVPALAVIEPATERFPATVKDEVVVIVPLTTRSAKIIPVPLIVFAAPDIVVVPPATCVN